MNRACFPKEKHQNSQKWANFMNFSFWPFLWFGLPGRLLKMDAAVWGGQTAGGSPKVLARIAFCEMLSQYPWSALRGCAEVTKGGQQQFATQTLRVHLLGIEIIRALGSCYGGGGGCGRAN